MPFDANLWLINGTVTYTAASAASFVAATSTTRSDTTGAVVLDLKGTDYRGLAIVLVIPVLASATDYLTMIIEGSEEEDFGESSYYNHQLAEFDIAAVTAGRILASECTAGAVVLRRISTNLRYIRVNGTPTAVGSTGTFGALQVLVSPYPWLYL